MAIKLIGLHRTWGGRQVSPAQRERFAAALGVVNGRPGQTSYDGGTLLASTGQNRGWHPQIAPDGSQILFAGHIANRQQLASELGIGRANDDVLYAAGFAAWGDAIDIRAIGHFATIVTHPDRHEVRLARSPIAAPPLFYWHDGETLIVASLVSAIFATGEVERRLDYTRIAGDCLRQFTIENRSNFEGVRRISCGQRAMAGRSGIAFETYYDLASLPEIRLKDDRDYVITATRLLEDGVRAALDGFSRPAISVSGGLDSQAVAAIAVRQRPGKALEAYTCVPEAGWDGAIVPQRFGDERTHVEALAAMYPEIRPHWIDAAGLEVDHKQASMFMVAGDAGPSWLGHFTHDLYANAQAQGCDVMLEAVYGNNTFSYSGLGTLPAMVRRGQWVRLWQEAKHAGKLQSQSAWRIIATQALLPLAPVWLQDAVAKLAGRADLIAPDPFESWCVLRRDYVDRLIAGQPSVRMRSFSATRLPACSRTYRLGLLALEENDFAEIKQAFDLLYGMETRDPTTYRPFLEFCLSIPDDQYFREGQSRWLARRMLKNLVPDMVVSESRKGMRVADWHLRLSRQRSKILADLDVLATDEGIAAMIDIASLRQALIDWPDTPPSFGEDWRLRNAVIVGRQIAQFIRFYENRNR